MLRKGFVFYGKNLRGLQSIEKVPKKMFTAGCEAMRNHTHVYKLRMRGEENGMCKFMWCSVGVHNVCMFSCSRSARVYEQRVGEIQSGSLVIETRSNVHFLIFRSYVIRNLEVLTAVYALCESHEENDIASDVWIVGSL